NLLGSVFTDTFSLINWLAFSPDGAVLASVSKDHTVKLWQPDTGHLERTFDNIHSDEVRGLAFSPDGGMLGTASRDHTAKIIDLSSGEVYYSLEHPDTLNGIAISPDGTNIATAVWNGQIYLWDAESAMQRFVLTGHTNIAQEVTFASDGRL
ncbi:MAG TPA: hypothetical protein PKE45_17940, partial [Caldilineaceae bacterium]|nr:hypothetical protein [Caldilineaceae bacterium]